MNKYRIVTSKQLSEGYLGKDGIMVAQMQFKIVSRLANGNYVVIDPEYAESHGHVVSGQDEFGKFGRSEPEKP